MAQRNDFADGCIRSLQRNTSGAESIDESDRLRSELLRVAEGLGWIPPIRRRFWRDSPLGAGEAIITQTSPEPPGVLDRPSTRPT